MSGDSEDFAREALRWSQRRHNDEFGRVVGSEGGGVSNVDLQEFGRLQAQVEVLIEADRKREALLEQLADDMTAIRLQLAEARGGWKILVMLGGASASVGGLITWAANHYLRGSP